MTKLILTIASAFLMSPANLITKTKECKSTNSKEKKKEKVKEKSGADF